MRGPAALVLAGVLGSLAPDAVAQPAGLSAAPPAPTGGVAPAPRSSFGPRATIVTGGLLVSVGFVLSWTGIGGLLYEATQHRSVPWAAPVSIASIPFEVVGSALVVLGALQLRADF
ncbi:MAG TPA: hypothetical protein VGL81_11950 [Polyangiaceae bacterium]|jgi:hypothetical protein